MHPESIFKKLSTALATIKCAYFFFKAIGLAATKLVVTNFSVNGKLHQRFTLEESRRGALHNLLLILLVLGANYFAIRVSYAKVSFGDRVEFELALDTLQVAYAAVCSVAILAVYALEQARIGRIAGRVEDLRESLESNGVASWPGVARVVLPNLATFQLLFFTTSSSADYEILMFHVGAYLSEIVITCAIVQYALVLQLMAHLLRMSNASLAKLSRKSIMRFGDDDNVATIKATSDKLSKLHCAHLAHCRALDDISSFYAGPMLLCVLHVFASALVHAYYFCKPLVTGRWCMSELQYAHCFLRVLHDAVTLAMLTRSVGQVVAEDKRTRIVVNEWLAGVSDDCGLVKMLNKFSIYLLHQNVRFTVFGLFSLDNSLLMSVVGCIATYLVILLQFQGRDSS